MSSVRRFKINSDLPGTRRSTRKQKLLIAAPTERRLTLMTEVRSASAILQELTLGNE